MQIFSVCMKRALLLTLAAAQIATMARAQTNAAAPAMIKTNPAPGSARKMQPGQPFAFHQSKAQWPCRSWPGDFAYGGFPLLVDTITAAQHIWAEMLLAAAVRQRARAEKEFAWEVAAQRTALMSSLLHLRPHESPSTPKSASWLKWGGLGAFWWAAFFDHYQDAIQDAGGRNTYLFGANSRHWHFVKNLAHLGYLAAGFCAGVELGQARVSPKHFALRTAGAVLIYWFIQNLVYDKALHNVWFDYGRKYTTDSIVIFDLTGKDHRIELSGWSRPALDLVRVALGTYLVMKY